MSEAHSQHGQSSLASEGHFDTTQSFLRSSKICSLRSSLTLSCLVFGDLPVIKEFLRFQPMEFFQSLLNLVSVVTPRFVLVNLDPQGPQI